MPEMGTNPVNKYLPPRPKVRPDQAPTLTAPAVKAEGGLLGWVDKMLEAL